MEVAVLGPVEVRLGGRAVDLGTPKQRALVASLALSRGRPVSVDAIVDLLWGDRPPPGVTATLQAYVSGLRRVIEPERERRAPATVLVTVAPGYALRVADATVDAELFDRTVSEQHRLLKSVSSGQSLLSATELGDASSRLDQCLGLWRGTPYGELGDAPSAVAERARLEELRLVALEDRAVAELALGHHGTIAAELEAMTGAHPLRERLWGLRALALTRSGRQADALDVLRQVRDVLADELGLEPGAELRDLQTAVLRQDPALEWVPPRKAAAPTVAEIDVPPAPNGPAIASPFEPVSRPPAEPVTAWPMVGRDRDLAALTRTLQAADDGTPSYAVLTGEPGIGKSRLASELVARARQIGGTQVLIGRCSQDDGAPPLWPWATVLEVLGAELPAYQDDEDEGAQFRAWEQITRTIRGAAADKTLLLVIDDLHWADTSSLRVLRLLAETAEDDRLMVLTTWRAHPEPTGELADVAEVLARRHALRLELDGLPADAVAEVFETVSHNRPSDRQAEELRARTDGNPFFLVEYARLAGERADLGSLLDEDNPPTAVSEVLRRRLARLPADTVSALRSAALIGRQFDTPTLATVTGIDEDDLLDVVEPAQAAGLVREDGVDRFVFAHALVRDTLRLGLTASRRARAHARIADALAGRPGRESEEAWHWRAAGPSHARRAWLSAVAASEVARRLHAHDRAMELLAQATESLDDDPESTPSDRYDVLMALVEACRWAAQWPELIRTVEEAIVVAESMQDPERVARAAISTTQGALWQSAEPGHLNDHVIDALRRSLERLPALDGALRCRAMLGLANELYYGSSYQERRVLVDEALAMARRLDDPGLLLDACQISFVALWAASTAPERLGFATEAMELSRRIGDERGFVVSATLRSVVLGELGRPLEMTQAAKLARREAERLRIAYGEVVLDSALIPWRAMAGRFEECAALIEHLRKAASQLSHNFTEEAVGGSLICLRLWQGRATEVVPALEAMDGQPFVLSATITVFLWRGGEEVRARSYHAEHGAPLDHDTWFSMLAWCHAGEAALYVGDSDLGRRAYDLLGPYAGRACTAGSSSAAGPVDAFLAFAAAAAGDLEVATEHADAAVRLCEEWELPLASRWVRDVRERYSF